MKFLLVLSTLPMVLAWLAPVALAYPVGGNFEHGLLEAHTALPVARAPSMRADAPVADLAARALWSTVKQAFTRKPPSEQAQAEAKQRAIWKAQHALRKAQDKHDSTIAKLEAGSKANYKVDTQWKPGAAGGDGVLGKVGHAQAQKYWQKNPEVQKFKHAEVSSKVHTDGRIWTTSRYHNGGASFSGNTVHMFTDHPKR